MRYPLMGVLSRKKWLNRPPARAFLAIDLFFLGMAGCGPVSDSNEWSPDDFAGSLHLGGTPNQAQDPSSFAFSDQGAWYMFGLPDPEVDSLPGSFPGPLLLSHRGMWLGESFLRPQIEVDGTQLPVEWDLTGDSPAVALPGRLRQELRAGQISIRVELIYSSRREALIRAALLNEGAATSDVRLDWVGGGFFLPVTLDQVPAGIRIGFPQSGEGFRLQAHGDPEIPSSPPGDGPFYRIRGSATPLGSGQRRNEFVRVLLESEVESSLEIPEAGSGNLSDLEGAFTTNRERWASYLNQLLQPPRRPIQPATADSARIVSKAIQTLISNWRTPRGHLFHDGLFPSYAYRGFHGIWSWDSWKHARALALFDSELAKNQIRVMLDHQNEGGMIPDVIYTDSTENNWRDTKPPLAAWAVHGIFKATSDTVFVGEVFPRLMAYHEWWYRDRDHDGNGLCEYGSTDGTRIAAAWESGMDNAVRFDDALMVENRPGAWSLSQESVDLNAYLYAEKRYLSDLADVMGFRERARDLDAEAESLGELIRSSMYDQETGYFYDIDLMSKEPILVQGPEGWIPLWAGVATPEQAARVAQIMTDPGKFAGKVPFPTLAMDHPSFDPLNGYWRGPVWLDQAYFAVRGLERYGFAEEARELSGRLLNGPLGLTGTDPIYENYHPTTGEGLNAPHFSWSAAHLLMLLAEGR